MCKKKAFYVINLHCNCDGYARTIFTRVKTKFKAQKWLHLTRLHSGEDQSFQLHISRKKKTGVNKTANSENIFKTGLLSNMGDPLTFHVIRKSKHGSS